MRVDIITLFPDMLTGILNDSILKIASEKKLAHYYLHNLRDYSQYNHKQVDDRPYGGGPGMLIMPDPVFRAVEAIEQEDETPSCRIILTPRGETYTQNLAREFSILERLMILCGRYEGFDQRIIDGLGFREISIGNYVLAGGEAAAMVIVESVIRLIPGVLGNEESPLKESFSDEKGTAVEYPQYTRPAEYRDMNVPEVLLSGNHEKIAEWRADKTGSKK
ncbi:tRNA (guanosine(37)-N1)-methyltransferase TrmD [Planctomycetota bacterium]